MKIKKTGLTKNFKNGCREISHLQSKTSVLLVQEDDTLKRKEMRFKKEQWLQNKHKNKKIEMKNNMVICWRKDKFEQGKVQWSVY